MNPRSTVIVALVLLVAVVGLWFVTQSWQTSSASGPSSTAAGNGSTPASASAHAVFPASTAAPGGASSPSAPGGVPPSTLPAGNNSTPGTPATGVLANGTPAAGSPPSDEAGSINAMKVRRMITDYHTLMGENPIGTNAEIMRAVMGGNSRQATLGPPDGLQLNAKGELVDDWGTPYFFHQLSKDRMEIHSAGPDKIMGTADDIVVR